MKKLVIFDLDGTLLYTGLDIQKTLNETLTRFNLPNISLEKTLEYVGNGAKHLVRCAIKNDPRLEEVYEYYRHAFAETKNELTSLYEGESEVLRKLKGKGVKLAILTNKPQDATENVVEKYLGEIEFDYVIGQGKFPLKPDPTACKYILDSCGLAREEAVLVGDGEADVQTALNAGIDCVSALWGYRTREQLEMVGSTIFAENYASLEKILMKL